MMLPNLMAKYYLTVFNVFKTIICKVNIKLLSLWLDIFLGVFLDGFFGGICDVISPVYENFSIIDL